jgi:hypothetical protein
MWQKIGQQFEDDTEGVALAQGDVEERDHALGQENEHADGDGREQRLGDLLDDVAV